MIDNGEWREAVERAREEKDAFFGSGHPQSPIPPADLLQFKGLDYYPPNVKYRFEINLYEHPEKKLLKVKDSKGGERELIRWGEFRFKIDDKNCILQVYKSNSIGEHLSLLFRDATSGKETYAAGRYLDLKRGTHQTSDGKWILDFNLAYNPWCAYSENYVCPFVPPENWLDVPIFAGEKIYKH
jgi:uncharacterized protein (DUF1684 family)